ARASNRINGYRSPTILPASPVTTGTSLHPRSVGEDARRIGEPPKARGLEAPRESFRRFFGPVTRVPTHDPASSRPRARLGLGAPARGAAGILEAGLAAGDPGVSRRSHRTPGSL